ncbi:MAG: hypothetical protein LBB76_06950 [Azoarcus sp.]|nr:hypothetical protein [Azoarcus sp.]
MKKIIFLIFAGYGIWFAAVGGKRLDEDIVRDFYRQAADALINNDSEAYCKLIDDDMHGNSKFWMPSRPTIPSAFQQFGKKEACDSLAVIQQMKEQAQLLAGISLHINYEYTIESISISPDRKTATVELHDEFRIGTEREAMLIMRSRQTNQIRRNLGRAKIFHSNSITRVSEGKRR